MRPTTNDIDNIKSLYLGNTWRKNFYSDKLPALMRLYTFKLEELDTKVRALNNMKMQEYIEYSLAAKKFYMNFDKSNLPQNIIKQRIKTIFSQ